MIREGLDCILRAGELNDGPYRKLPLGRPDAKTHQDPNSYAS